MQIWKLLFHPICLLVFICFNVFSRFFLSLPPPCHFFFFWFFVSIFSSLRREDGGEKERICSHSVLYLLHMWDGDSRTSLECCFLLHLHITWHCSLWRTHSGSGCSHLPRAPITYLLKMELTAESDSVVDNQCCSLTQLIYSSVLSIIFILCYSVSHFNSDTQPQLSRIKPLTYIHWIYDGTLQIEIFTFDILRHIRKNGAID